MLSLKLKELTLSAHKRLESHPLFHSIASNFDKEQYTRLLSKLHAYYVPLEEQYVSLLQDHPAVNVHSRKRAHLLGEDVMRLASHALKRTCSEVPVLQTLPQALGALYVIEGSTLGAKFIYKSLAQAGVDKENGASYFYGYGEQTGSQWSAVVSSLNEITEEKEQQEVIDSANAVFSSLYNWLDKDE